jgi:uncharacterized protein involved in exopolysaccharide biosynthesis
MHVSSERASLERDSLIPSPPHRAFSPASVGEPLGAERLISLRDFAFILFSRGRTILTVTALVMAGIAFSVFWLISPTYESKARVHVDIQTGSLPVLRAAGTYVSDAEKLSYFETVIQEMKNQSLIAQVVEELDLGHTRKIGNIERIKNAVLELRRRFALLVGIEAWQKPLDPVAASVAAVTSGLAVNRLENSTILELTYGAHEARETERTLSTIIRLFIASRAQFTREKATGSTQFLSQELTRLRSGISEIEEKWLELVNSDVYVLPIAASAREGARGAQIVTGLSTNEAVVDEMKLRIVHSEEELQTALTRYAPTDANVVRLQRQIRAYADVINNAPKIQARMRQLKREMALKESTYRELLAAYENALTMDSKALPQLSTVKIVQPPGVPGGSARPNRTMAIFAGIFLGGFLGVLAAIVSEFFDDTIKRPRDVQARLGIRYISSMPAA